MEGGISAGRIAVLGGCVAGIWMAYVYQGVLQEILSTKKFGPDGVRFQHLTFLGLSQNVVCLIWSFIMLLIWSPNRQSQAPLWTFWSASISNSIGPACGILALKYISYPAQVLAKSSKMIPVMLMGAVVYGVRYTFPEYLCTFLVAGGVATFALFKSSSKAISKIASPNAPLGYTNIKHHKEDDKIAMKGNEMRRRSKRRTTTHCHDVVTTADALAISPENVELGSREVLNLPINDR